MYHNLDISLWHDEAFSALLIKYPWGEMFYRIGLDVHPPAYYVALRLWHYVLGDSLLALRGFSVFFGLATAIAGYGFVKAAFKSERVAIITAFLVVLNPFQIQYATEARMYTFGAFLAVLAAYFLVKALNQHVTSDKLRVTSKYFIAFGLTAGIASLTHYYLLFTVAALCFYALCWHIYHYRTHFRNYLSLVTSYLLLILVFAPWIQWFLFQFKQVGAGYWIPPMDKWSIPTTLWEMFLKFPYTLSQRQDQILIIASTLLLLAIVVSFIWKTKNNHKWLVILGLTAPFAGSVLFLALATLKGQDSSVYLVRYFLYASTFLIIVFAAWLSRFKHSALTYTLLAVYAIANLWAFQVYWHNLDVKTKPGMAAAVQHLSEHMHPNDKLFVGSSFEFFNLKYYLTQVTPPAGEINSLTNMSSHTFALEDLSDDAGDTGAPSAPQTVRYWPRPLLYSGGNTSTHNIPHFAGTAILTDADLLPQFEAGAKSGDTVWLLWTNGFGGSKPTVPQSFHEVSEAGFAEVRPYVGTWIVITKYLVQ